MTTVKANLVTTDYVRINQGNNPIMLDAHRDGVRLVFADTLPLRGNSVFHLIKPEHDPLVLPFNDRNIYALPTSDRSSLFVTEFTGNNPSGINQGSKSVFVSEFGELTTAQRVDDIAVNFHYGISTLDVTDSSTGTGSISDVGSDAAIDCGAGIGTGKMESEDSVRYRAGRECITMFTHDQSELQSGVDVVHGLINEEDGVAVGSQGATVGTWFVEGSNENFTAQADWELDKLDGSGASGFTLDMTQRNLFAITYGYLSIAPIRYYIHTGAKGWVEFHNIYLNNSQAEGHLKNPTLPMSAVVRRISGSGTSVQVKTGSWRAGNIGDNTGRNPADRFFPFSASRNGLGAINLGTDPDLWHNLFTLTSATTFNSKPNHIRAELLFITSVADANKSVELAFIRDGTLVGNAAFVEIDSLNSIMSSSIGGTVEGVSTDRSVLAKVADRRDPLKDLGNFIYPGGQLSVGIRGIGGSAVTGDLGSATKWVEEF